jgi:hypothetical protein
VSAAIITAGVALATLSVWSVRDVHECWSRRDHTLDVAWAVMRSVILIGLAIITLRVGSAV